MEPIETIRAQHSEEPHISIEEDDCEYIEGAYVFERFLLVAVLGTLIAVINIVENIMLCCMLFRRKKYRSSHHLYLALLAFFDVLIAGAYIPLMSLNHVVDFFRSVVLLRAWFAYMIPMITVSHIAMTASSFLMFAASFERFCVTAKPQYTKFLSRHRTIIATGSVVLGIITKITHGLEFQITEVPECVNTMNEFLLEMSPLARNETYMAFWKIWIRSVFTVLLPFVCLAFMNFRVVVHLRKKDFQFLTTQKLSEAKRKSRVRAATRTLVFVVFTYLMSNILNVIITIWEYIDYETLTIQFNKFYIFAVDLVSILTVLAGALRLPIYVTCQSELRKDFKVQLQQLCSASYYKNFCKRNDVTAVDAEDKQNSLDDKEDDAEYPSMFFKLGTVLLLEKRSEEPVKCVVDNSDHIRKFTL